MRLPRPYMTTTLAMHPRARALRLRVNQLLRVNKCNALPNTRTPNRARRADVDPTLWSSRRARGLGAPVHAAGC